MDDDLQTNELLRKYLLRELSEEATEDLEKRLLEDDELFDLCEAIEADLLTAYDRRELNFRERKKVRRCLLSSPAGQARLTLARSLDIVAAESLAESAPSPAAALPFRPKPAPHLGLRWAALAAAVLIVAIGILWVIRPPVPPEQIANEISTPKDRDQTAAPSPSPRPVEKAPKTVTPPRNQPDSLPLKDERASTELPQKTAPEKAVLMLSLATFRGAEEGEKLLVPAGAETIEIQLDLGGLADLKPFSASVRNAQNETVWKKGDLEPRRLDWTEDALVLEIPAERLPTGNYKVAVTAASITLTKEFHIEHEQH
jgi:hypothetical protein